MVERKKNISSVVNSIIKSSKSKEIGEVVKPKKAISRSSNKALSTELPQPIEDAPKRGRKKAIETKAETLKENLKKVVSEPKASKKDANVRLPISAEVVGREPTIEEIQFKAYLIWEREGCQHGKDKLYWDMAVAELKLGNN